jgi:hypothetical protein
LRAHNLDLPIALITDQPFSDPAFDSVHVPEVVHHAKRLKLQLDETPFQQALYLDTDTRITGDLTQLFGLLERFDFVAHQFNFSDLGNQSDIPRTFAQANSGVMLFNNNKPFRELMENWRRAYQEYTKKTGQHFDQPSLRRALWETDIKLGWLRGEFNFMPYYPNTATCPAFVLHGRPQHVLDKLEREINARPDLRSYIPDLGVVHQADNASYGELFRLILRTAIFACRKFARSILRR